MIFICRPSLSFTDFFHYDLHKIIVICCTKLSFADNTVWKVSVFEDFLVRTYPCSVHMRKNTDQKTPNRDTFQTVQFNIINNNVNSFSLGAFMTKNLVSMFYLCLTNCFSWDVYMRLFYGAFEMGVFLNKHTNV